jgi:hypothetical protein
MYKYVLPKPIIIPLQGEEGFELRKKAVEFVERIRVRGAEAGSAQEQTYGILAQMAIRKMLELPLEPDEDQSKGFDILLPSGVKVDIKCRGGTKPFQEKYMGSGNLEREAKHNFFARQVWNEELDTDIYVMVHLECPKAPRGKKTALPGTKRQRKWKLYICGWVSKDRVKKEGVYLPRGAITERGNEWFAYRGHEIEFYNKHLNGFSDVKDLLLIDKKDVEEDKKKSMNLHLTSVDAIRIALDMVGHGIIDKDVIEFLKEKLGVKAKIPTIMHSNQYHHLLKWLKAKGKIKDSEIKKLNEIMQEMAYSE